MKNNSDTRRKGGLRLLGLGFWQAWWMVAMTTDVLVSRTAPEGFIGDPVLWITALTTLGYLIAVLLSRVVTSFSSYRGSFYLAGIGASLGSLGMYLSTMTPLGKPGFALFLLSTVLLAAGNALLLLMWGELWSVLATGRVGRHLYFSYSFAFVLYFVIWLLPGVAATILTVLFPLFSTAILYTCKNEPKRMPSVVPVPQGSLPSIAVFVALLLVSIVYGMSQELVISYVDVQQTTDFMLKMMAMAGVCIWAVTLSMVVSPSAQEPLVLYRPVIPAMACGILLLVLLPSTYAFVGAGLIIMGVYCLDMLMMLVSTDIAFRARLSVAFTFGLAIFAARCGTLIGSFSAHFAAGAPLWNTALRDDLMLFGVLVLVLVGMLLFTQFDVQHLYRTQGIMLGETTPTLGDKCAMLAASCGLTAREAEVLVLLASGRSVPYICDELSIAQGTAKHHVSNIYRKLGVVDRQGLHDVIEQGAAGKGAWELQATKQSMRPGSATHPKHGA